MKIDLLKTITVTMIMIACALLISVIPGLIIMLAPFLLIPVTYLYYHSRNSYYVMSLIVIIVASLLQIFALQVIIAAVLGGYILGQLLIERSSKERMLYILTVFYSIYTLLSIIFLQLAKLMPTTDKIIEPTVKLYSDVLEKEVEMGNVNEAYPQFFQQSMDQMVLQIPGVIIFFIFLLVLLQLVITLPLLRHFKIPTPNFRPLYLWRMPKMALYMYFIVVVIRLFTMESDVVVRGIVMNLEYVLEWIIFIQGLSLFSFFIKVKKLPVMLSILLYGAAFLMAPVTQFFGMLDLILNLKMRITKR